MYRFNITAVMAVCPDSEGRRFITDSSGNCGDRLACFEFKLCVRVRVWVLVS